MGITEEGTYMGDESKRKAVLPGKKVIGLFILRNGERRLLSFAFKFSLR